MNTTMPSRWREGTERESLNNVLDTVKRGFEVAIADDHAQPFAVIIPIEEYKRLTEGR